MDPIVVDTAPVDDLPPVAVTEPATPPTAVGGQPIFELGGVTYTMRPMTAARALRYVRGITPGPDGDGRAVIALLETALGAEAVTALLDADPDDATLARIFDRITDVMGGKAR